MIKFKDIKETVVTTLHTVSVLICTIQEFTSRVKEVVYKFSLWAVYITTFSMIDWFPKSATETYVINLKDMSSVETSVLKDIASSTLNILNANYSAEDTSLALTRGHNSPFRRVLRFTAPGYEARATHLKHTLKACIRSKDLIDVEGFRYSKMFGPADLVTYEKGRVVLTDFTADESLREAKIAALTTAVKAIKMHNPDVLFSARVSLVTEERVRVMDPHEKGTMENPIFHAISLLSEEVIKKNIDPTPFLDEISSNIKHSPREKAPLSKDIRKVCVRVASGDEVAGDIEKVIDAACESYPEMVKRAALSFSRVNTTSKGMPPPSIKSAPISTTGKTWASLLALAIEAEEKDFICWREGEPPWISRRAELCTVRLHKRSTHYFKFDLDVGAPREWEDLVKRINPYNPRTEEKEIAPVAVDGKYISANDFCEFVRMKGETYVTGDVSLASKVIADSDPIDRAHELAGALTQVLLDGVSRTYGYAVMQTAKCATASCALAACAGKTGEFRLTSHMAGRVLVLSKKTGDLNANNDTSCIMAVADPVGPDLTWEEDRDDGVALSKCLMISTRLRDHLDEAEGNSIGIACAYADGTKDMATGIGAASLACIASVSANKQFGVVTSMERQLCTGSCSIYNSIDKVAKKMESFSPSTLVEACIVTRIVMRSLACALLRDEGGMKYIMRKDDRGSKSPIYCPCLAASTCMDYTGLTNSVYDYVLGSSQSASAVRNEAKAFVGVFAEADDYSARIESGDESLLCMSQESFDSCQRGEISEFVGTPEFYSAERRFIRDHMHSGKKHMASASLLVSYAHRYSKEKNLRPSIRRITEECSQLTIDKSISTKRAAEVLNIGMFRAAEPAYRTLLLFISRMVGSSAIAFRAASMIGLLFGNSFLGDTDLFSMALAATFCPEDYYVICKAKDYTVEKTRDFFMMSANLRLPQCFHEQVSLRISSLLEWSALTAGSKISVLNKVIDKGIAIGKALLCVMTDKTRYGPSRIPGVQYGIIAALGVEGPALTIYRNSLHKMMAKRVRPADLLFRASANELQRAEESVAPGLMKYLRRCFASKDYSAEVVPGTGQGLTQATSDVFTAIATGILEEVLSRKYHKATCVSTNDDGVSLLQVDAREVWQAAQDITEIHIIVGTITGEALNETKVSVSTWNVDLNTQFRQIGDTQNVNGGCLPWAREVCASTRSTNISDTMQSLYAAWTSVNGAVDEGAPLFATMAGIAMSTASHYKRFRFAEKAFLGEYIENPGTPFSAPIIAPFLVRAYGPKAVACAFEAKRRNCEVAPIVEKILSSSVISDCVQVGSLSWVDTENDIKNSSGKVYTKYTFSSIPYARIMADKELKTILETANLPGKLNKVRPNSLSEKFLSRMAELADFSSNSVLKSCSTTVSWASSSFALNKERVVATDISIKDSSAVMTERRINIGDMLEEMEGITPDLRIKGVASWGVTTAVIDQTEQVLSILNANQRKGELRRGLMRKTVETLSIFPSRMTYDEKMALLYQIVPEKHKAETAYRASLEGVHVAPMKSVNNLVGITDRIRMDVAAERLSTVVYGKSPPPIILNTRTDKSSLISYASTAPNSDIGLGFYLPFPNIMVTEVGDEVALTPSEAAVKRKAAEVIQNVVEKCSNLEISGDLPKKSLKYVASTADNMELISRNYLPVSLAPESSRDFKKMSSYLSTCETSCLSSRMLCLKSLSSSISDVQRRYKQGHSIQRTFSIKLSYKGRIDAVPATINKFYREGITYRSAACLALREEDPHEVRMFVDGSNRLFVKGSGTTWMCSYTHRTILKEVYIDVIRANDEIIVFPTAYPPCLVASLAGSERVAILRDLDDMTKYDSRKYKPEVIVTPIRQEIDLRTKASINRLSDYLCNVPGLPGAYASHCALAKIGRATIVCLESVANLEAHRIKSTLYADAKMTSEQVLSSHNRIAEMAVLSSLLVSNMSAKFSLLTHNPQDSADIYALIRSHAYSSGMISSKEEGERDRNVLPELPKDADAVDILLNITEAVRLGMGDDEEDIDIDAPMLLEDPAEALEAELGITSNVEVDGLQEVLGLTGLPQAAEMVSTLPATSRDLKRYYVGKGAVRNVIAHVSSVNFLAEIVSDKCLKASKALSRKYKTSITKVTSIDITNSYEGVDARYISRALKEYFLVASIISHHSCRAKIEEVRRKAMDLGTLSENPLIIVAIGREETREVKDAREFNSNYLRTVSTVAEISDLSDKMMVGNFLTSHGVVNMA